MKVSLQGRDIPRNRAGDPTFTSGQTPRLFDVFSLDEVHELVNRCVYQLEYQSNAHRKRQQQQRLLEKPVREMFSRLFPKQSWLKATPGEIARCVEEVRREGRL